MKTKELEFVDPVPGAARYWAGQDEQGTFGVFMDDMEGFVSMVDTASNAESANRKAVRLQRKENKVVLKNRKVLQRP